MHRKRKHLYFFIFLIITSIFWWFFYLLNIFPNKYHANMSHSLFDNSGIVVLTGGKGRFEKGFSLLKDNFSEKLFVSGVYPGLDLKKKYIFNDTEAQLFDCCVFYGNEALNTKQNSQEVKEWVRENEMENIYLVTSYYHLPRAKIIFEEDNPNLNILLVPADDKFFNSNKILTHIFNIKLIIIEYMKILYITIFGI